MTRDSARRYLIAYDITDDRRRSNLSKLLQSFGDRIQHSVFACDLKPARLVRLREAIRNLIIPEIDSVLICDLGQASTLTNSQFAFIGATRYTTPDTAVIT
jgi:CRISPR-associated protein Cas2